jgi:hypothetical protein
MPRILLATATLLALCACNATGQGAPAPVQATKPPSEPAADQCGAGKLGGYVNQLPTSEVMAAIERTVGQHRIRTIRPGDVVTMDFSADRLNIEVGEDGRIKRFRCG